MNIIKQKDLEKINSYNDDILYKIKNYYIEWGLDKTHKQFNLCSSSLKQYFNDNNILRTKEDINYYRKKHLEDSCLKKYGVKNIFENHIYIKNKFKEKYGVEHNSRLKEIIDKRRDTFNRNKNINIQHQKEGSIKKYGVDNPSKVLDIKKKISNKIKESNIKKYGVHNVMLIPDIKDKARNNNWTQEVKEKRIEKYIQHYGVDNPFKSEVVKNNIKEILKDKYGVDSVLELVNFNDSYRNSKVNKEFARLLDDNNISYEKEFHLDKYYYDFKIDNIFIEINPSITHNINFNPFNDKSIDKDYHINKSKVAEDNGYRCIHIFDWIDKNKIINLLKHRDKVYARKCIIKEVSKDEVIYFLNTYHMQGYSNYKIALGLYYNNELISLITLGKPRYNKNYEYELIRFCSNKNVIGGIEKLFNYFLNTYKPNSIISYCDRSIFSGDTYIKLGFQLKNKNIKPSKHWYNLKTGRHITDNLLRQQGFDRLFNTNYGKGTSNEELMIQNNFVEIYDCGQATYVYKR